MPEEAQKNSSEELIDVGETVGAEINLDDKGEPEKVEAHKEEKIELEEVTDVPVQEDKREPAYLANITQSPTLHQGFPNFSLSLYARSPIFKT